MDPLAIVCLVLLGIALAVIIGLGVERTNARKQLQDALRQKHKLQGEVRKLHAEMAASGMNMEELVERSKRRLG